MLKYSVDLIFEGFCMRKVWILFLSIAVLFIGYELTNNMSYAKNDQDNAIENCVKQLDTLTSEDVAACYHKNMPDSTLTNDTVKDKIGRTLKFTIKGTCTPNDDCKIRITQGRYKYDVRLWYDMSENERE